MKLPEEFCEKMKQLLKEEFSDYIACYDEPRYYGLRVNTNKISVEEFERICPFEIRPIPWIKNGFYYDGDVVVPSRNPYYYAGLYYLQEPSAMTPANRLPVEPGDRVLDVCAAPGGKATELGAKLQGEGLLAANDISSSRAKGLLKNLEVFGTGNVIVLSEEPGRLEGYFEEYFDKILIDAPCSGEGMFRKDKKMIKAWEEHGPEYFCGIQKSIVLQAARMLKPGGLMLYSTCTFDGRENEQVIEHLLTVYPEFRIEEIEPYEGFREGMPELTKGKNPELKKTVRIFPHRMKGEGHYLALVRKGGHPEESGLQKSGLQETGSFSESVSPPGFGVQSGFRQKSVKSGKYRAEREKSGTEKEKSGRLPEELEIFLGHIRKAFDYTQIEIQGERVYYMPEGITKIRGLRFLRKGLLMGELKKKRFEPSQALAMYLRMEEYGQCLNLSAGDERVLRYLKGETLDAEGLTSPEASGWYLVCVDGYPLGWGKVVQGVLKNKYLPGWRLNA